MHRDADRRWFAPDKELAHSLRRGGKRGYVNLALQRSRRETSGYRSIEAIAVCIRMAAGECGDALLARIPAGPEQERLIARVSDHAFHEEFQQLLLERLLVGDLRHARRSGPRIRRRLFGRRTAEILHQCLHGGFTTKPLSV